MKQISVEIILHALMKVERHNVFVTRVLQKGMFLINPCVKVNNTCLTESMLEMKFFFKHFWFKRYIFH